MIPSSFVYVRAVFTWVRKVIQVGFGVSPLHVVFGLKNSRHFLGQSKVKPKPIVAALCTFFSASLQLHAFDSGFHLFTGLSPSFGLASVITLVLVYDTRLKSALLLYKATCIYSISTLSLYITIRGQECLAINMKKLSNEIKIYLQKASAIQKALLAELHFSPMNNVPLFWVLRGVILITFCNCYCNMFFHRWYCWFSSGLKILKSKLSGPALLLWSPRGRHPKDISIHKFWARCMINFAFEIWHVEFLRFPPGVTSWWRPDKAVVL